MNQFYNLIRSFLILATLFAASQANAQNIIYLERFPNIWNPSFFVGPGNDTTNQNLGTYRASSSVAPSGPASRIVGAVNSPGFFDSTSLLFIDSVNNTGSSDLFELRSPLLDLSAYSADTTIQLSFLVNTTGLDSNNTCATYSIQFHNSATGFSTVWTANAHQLDSTYGDTGWHQVTIPIDTSLLTSDFQIFFDNTLPDACGTVTSTLAIDNLVISTGAFNILPVNIISFTANYNNYTANLHWTVDESGIKSYTVERSSDGRNFQSISSLVALNNSSRTNYTYSDNLKGFSGANVFYRLNILENSGYQHYSKIISLKTALISGVSLSPNPARSYTNLSFNANNNQTALIEVFDANGRAKINQRVSLFRGANTVQLDKLDQLPAGVYMIRTTVDGKMIASKVVVE
jgi:hypothetical protein